MMIEIEFREEKRGGGAKLSSTLTQIELQRAEKATGVCLKDIKSQLIRGVFSSIQIREIDMTKNYNRNKKLRAKLMKEKAKAVMALLSKRRCESSQSSGHDGRRQRPRFPQGCSRSLVPTSTIVVKGLPKEATEEMIHQILEKWRPFCNVRVMVKKNSSGCRGIAFVDFPSVVAAQKMMDEIGDGGLDVNGRKLFFEYRLGKMSELAASEDPMVNAGAPDSRDPDELRILKVGDEPYESHSAENNCVLFSLVRSAKALEDTFNSLEGVTCEKADEGLYLFPRIQFPQKAIKAADAAKTAPDAFYAKHLVEATGIVVLPGSDFGQVPGIWCIGFPILLQKMEISEIITSLTDFHQAFMAEFHD